MTTLKYTNTVFITGCSTGIGRALALACLERGDLVFATARKIESLNDIEHERLVPIALDVNDDAAIAKAMAIVTERVHHIDLLVNNAGYAAMGPVLELSHDKLLAQFETNVFAPLAITRAALPLLRAANGSQVVNVGSVSGILTTPFSGAYCATKAALHSLSDAMRMELAPFKIRVITVQPGAIQSSFGENSLSSVSGLIAEDSLYEPVKADIEARAMASQQHPTTAADFCATLLRILKDNPGAVVRIGNGSMALPLMRRLFPISWLDAILSKKFGLNKLR
ncbi:MAG: SDR family oxidoreductase [Thalassolituus sp.]|jgi:NAD(P)-dependent dehydrogenase (short-subunit alcohol dehydrogenase family)|uniref:SDR family oxidoreductase n=1 Tax=Thalassolituus TaxID=187492 RepID=UPI0009492E28|nr:SDR family oxidoreductase [Thalassolituus oleivorans]APR67539.1 short-chain dehydrogenase [Thalassolituus oleivorans]PCI47818.1 MAG: short-chain dehydrogenase [Oceanospirillales bacterium]PHQ87055.1 MAG: short-chain dehydrogenase [Thalassobium sp.]